MHSFRRITRILAAGALLTCAASAQWFNLYTPNIPRTADGKPNLTAPAPKLPDGKLDLTQVWDADPQLPG